MEYEVRADPVELTRCAAQLLRARQDLAGAWRDVLQAGGTPAAVDDAELAVNGLVAVLEGDVDRLYRVAFAYEQADRRAAARAGGAATGPAR